MRVFVGQFSKYTLSIGIFTQNFCVLDTTVLSMDEEHSSKPNLPEIFRNSHHARKIIQTTQPIFEEFSTSLRTVRFSNETEVTYATSFFSQVGFYE